MKEKNQIKETLIQEDTLRSLFNTIRENLTPESETVYTPLTEIFYNWLREKIDARELIVMQIRGEVRTTKSTTSISIGSFINKYIEKVGLNKIAYEGFHKRIFSDQTEFLRFINETDRNLCIVIDEFSSLAKTGANSTTEEALLDHYSDIFAGQYLHRICNGTDVILDKNTTVILETGMGIDKDKNITRCKLIYRDVVTKQQLTLGHVDIDNSEVIENWITKGLREIIETQGNPTPANMKLVEEYKAKDFYVRYQIKKYKRMDLLKKHGVRDIRELEFAELVLDAIKELSSFSKHQRTDRELVTTIVDEVIRQKKRIYSIIAKMEIAQKVSAILTINFKLAQMDKNAYKAKSKMSDEEYFSYERGMEQLADILKARMKEQNDLKEVYRKYLQVEAEL